MTSRVMDAPCGSCDRQPMIDADATEQIHAAMPLCATLGVRAESFGSDEVVLTLEWDEKLCTSGGVLHGGVLMALADAAGGACAFLNLPSGATATSTLESKTNFIGAVREGRVQARARPLHLGSTTIVVESAIDTAERLVAKVTQTQLVLRP